ncbi:MAG: hypothetical protein WBL53_15175 [Pseudonocardiaceae bacterium]
MTYTLDIDPVARAQIRELPPAGAIALADALAVLELVPERGEPLNADNPDGGVYQLPFGSGCGLITYLLLAARRSGSGGCAPRDVA